MSSYEALAEARSRGLDLVEIHHKSDPSICKIMNYGKWKFETKKKEKQNKRNQNKVLIKEIQIRTRTDEGDIKIKLQKAREFLAQGHKVKINLRFFGREMAHKDLGFKLLKQLEQRLSDVAECETPAKMERRALFIIMAPLNPKSKKGKDLKTEKAAEQSKESAENAKKPESLLSVKHENERQLKESEKKEDRETTPKKPSS